MTSLSPCSAFLFAVLVILSAAPLAEARSAYGVVGARGAAVVGEDRAAAVTRRGVAVSGPNGTAVARRPVAVAPRPVVVTPSPVMYQGSTVYVVVR